MDMQYSIEPCDCHCSMGTPETWCLHSKSKMNLPSPVAYHFIRSSNVPSLNKKPRGDQPAPQDFPQLLPEFQVL
ncbi:hypothetical protein SDJN02_19379, partial [Cucurbita argyrosperma subsp. argyrosperma]